MTRHSLYSRLALLGACLSVLDACGGGDDNSFLGGGTTRVTEIAVQDSPLAVGKSTVMAVNFEYDQGNVFNDEGSVRLVVRLPPKLRFRIGSAEINGVAGRDEGVEPQILGCSDGVSYLSFNLNRFDLDNADSPTGADSVAQLTLTVDALAIGAAVVVEAAADESRVIFGCNTDFPADEQDVVTIR